MSGTSGSASSCIRLASQARGQIDGGIRDVLFAAEPTERGLLHLEFS